MKKVSIVIPVFNEEKTVADILTAVEQVSLPDFEREVIVVDDGSTDSTAKIIQQWQDRFKILSHPVNRGKGAALRTGFAHATGNYILVQDADREYDPHDYPILLKPIINGSAHVVFGSRRLDPTKNKYVYRRYLWGGIALNKIVNWFTGVGINDIFSGSKVFPRTALTSLDLHSNGFEIETELTVKLSRLGYTIIEVPISYQARTIQEGKKIRPLDAFKIFFVALKSRWSFVNTIVRHKLLIGVLTIGFCTAFGYALFFHVRPLVDAKAYNSIAWSIVQDTGYTETTNPIPNAAIGRLGPGYEFFLAATYMVFGHRLWIVWLIQSLLHVGSAFLIYLIIRRLYTGDYAERFAVLGSAFYIFFIDLLEFPAMLLTETLYLFLVLAGLYHAIQMWEKPTLDKVLATSIILTLALLVRPPVAVFLLLSFAFLLIRHLWQYALVFALVSLVLLTPWTVRNYITYHRFIVTSAILGYDVWVGNSPDSKYIGELTASNEIDRYTGEKGLFATNERGIQEVKNLAFQHPWEFLKLQLTKTSIYFSAARPAAFWFHLSGISQVLTIIFSSSFAYILFVFGLSGLWIYVQRPDTLSRMLVLATLAAPAGIIWIVAETRYRYQFYPMMIILGVLFVAELIKNKKLFYKPLLIVASLVTVNTLFDALHNVSRVLDRIHRLF